VKHNKKYYSARDSALKSNGGKVHFTTECVLAGVSVNQFMNNRNGKRVPWHIIHPDTPQANHIMNCSG
jgi:hypothetical protein